MNTQIQRTNSGLLQNFHVVGNGSATAANFCHLPTTKKQAGGPATRGFRVVGWEATECEWRDPESPCTTTLMQGVPTGALSLTSWCVGKLHVQLGENASYRHGRGRIFGISRLRPRSLPLLRSPLEM